MKKLVTLLTIICFAMIGKANNIQTANVFLNGQNTASDFTMIHYDISWENSWRTSTNESNYDGCWIFAKFRKNNTSAWKHCTINYVSPGTAAASGHVEAGGSTIKTSNESKGVWQYRDANGIGSVNWADNQLRWNYGSDGVLDADSVEVKIFAVEMVYIPQGAYYLGSGSTTEVNRFRDGLNDTYLNITSEAALTVGLSAENVFGYGNNDMASGSIPAAFPKGYNAFWIMKYELSQQAYVDFLNTLDFAGATARNMGYTGSHPNIVAPQPERAADVMSSTDLLSWLDWAAMRPFTEMEYEKACRGSNITPLANEYAWGNTTLTHVAGIQNATTISESFTTGGCNYSHGVLNRPMRCGASANITSNRLQSGATYYGVMEMSGNVYERAVVAGYTQGRVFTGTHGDGALNTAYEFNVANWPLNTGSGLTWRGGGYQATINGLGTLQISDRTSSSAVNTSRVLQYGGRGARTAQ
jgi:formylglycine-generating enzyme required for sulfatase activity